MTFRSKGTDSGRKSRVTLRPLCHRAPGRDLCLDWLATINAQKEVCVLEHQYRDWQSSWRLNIDGKQIRDNYRDTVGIDWGSANH